MNISYGPEVWVPIAGMIIILFWGLRLLSRILMTTKEDAKARTIIAESLLEKSDTSEVTSFSRVAGAIGAISLAAFFTGLGLWILFGINDADAKIITRIQSIGDYLWTGAALFAPYAVNQVSKAFKNS